MTDDGAEKPRIAIIVGDKRLLTEHVIMTLSGHGIEPEDILVTTELGDQDPHRDILVVGGMSLTVDAQAGRMIQRLAEPDFKDESCLRPHEPRAKDWKNRERQRPRRSKRRR